MAKVGQESERRWAGTGIEPSLQEIMSDPIVHLVMRRDRLVPADLWRVIAVFQARSRGSGRLARSSEPAVPADLRAR